MTTEVLAQTLQAGLQATFGRGRIWYIKSASASLNITAEKLGSGARIWKFINVGAGFKFKAELDSDGWDYLRVVSAVGQAIEIVIGDDDVEVANAVSVTGTAAVAIQPSTTVADTADAALASGVQVNIPANAARKRITIGNTAASTNIIRVSTAGGAARGIEIQPGMYERFETTSALIVRNDNGFGTAASATWYAEEET